MGLTEHKEKKVKKLVRTLMTGHEAERENAFEELSKYFRDDDIRYIYELLGQYQNVQACVWLVRYLVEVERPLGFDKLTEMASHENQDIRQEVCRNIKKIERNTQVDLLFQLIESSFEDVVCQAIRGFAELRERIAIPVLVRKLEESPNEKVTTFILRCLSVIEDRRCIAPLQKLLPAYQGDIRTEALGVLGHFAPLMSHKDLMVCIHHDDFETRNITFLALLKQRDKKWEKYIVLGLDQEDSIKINILSSLRTIKSRSLFERVFQLGKPSETSHVRMMALSSLKRIRTRAMLSWLLKALKEGVSFEKEMVLRLLGLYDDYPRARKSLKQCARFAEDPKLRVIAIESMSQMYGSEVQSELLKIVKEKSDFSLAAAISYARHFERPDWKVFKEMLSLSESQGEVIQVFMSLVFQSSLTKPIPEEIYDLIEEYLRSPNQTLRYWAFQCLATDQKMDRFQKIAINLVTEKDALVRRSSHKALIRVLSNQPKKLRYLVSLSISIHGFFSLVYQLYFKTMVFGEEHLMEDIRSIFKVIDSLKMRQRSSIRFDMARLLLLVRARLVKGKGYFHKVMTAEEWTEEQKQGLLRCMRRTDIHSFKGLVVDELIEDAERSSTELKKEYLRFFGQLSYPSKKLMDYIYQILETSDDKEICQVCEAMVKKWMANIEDIMSQQTKGSEIIEVA